MRKCKDEYEWGKSSMSVDELPTLILPSFLPILLPNVDYSSGKIDNWSLWHMAQRKEDIATESDPDKNYRSYLEFNLQTRANALYYYRMYLRQQFVWIKPVRLYDQSP